MGTILRVTELEVRDHPHDVVRANASVAIVARTESVEVEGPTDLHIEWSGGLGASPHINGNTLHTAFAPGVHPVTATAAAGGSSVTVRAWQSETDMVNGPDFALTDDPGMPTISAHLRITGPVAATFDAWRCRVRFAGADDCPNVPHFEVINDDLDLAGVDDRARETAPAPNLALVIDLLPGGTASSPARSLRGGAAR